MKKLNSQIFTGKLFGAGAGAGVRVGIAVLTLAISLQSLAVTATQFSIPELCQASDQSEVVGMSPDMCDLGPDWPNFVATASFVQIYQKITSQCRSAMPYYYTNMPWMLLRSPRLEVRRVAHVIQQELVQQVIRQASGGKDQTLYKMLLENAAKQPAVYSSVVQKQVDSVIAHAPSNASMNDYLTEVRPYTSEICLIFADPGCGSALKDAFDISHVISLYNKDIDMQISVTMVEETRKLFVQSHFNRGLAIAALHISDLADQALKGNLPKTHLLDDLVSSFEEAGYDATSAYNLSFTFLAFYGTRGASMMAAIDLVTPENTAVMVSSMLIASSLGILDSYTLASGHPYSLPPTVTTGCVYGSPYHFWMPAAMAWQLVQKHHSARSSMISAHILGVGYEALASTINRNPWDKLTIPSTAVSNNTVRINIAMNDAGARFGAELAAGAFVSKTNIDSRINILMNAAGKVPALTKDQAAELFKKKYLFISRWLLVFMPNAGFYLL